MGARTASRLGSGLPALVVIGSLAAVSLVVALAVNAWLTGGDARAWREPATLEGTTLVLTYLDSACRNREHVDVRETSESVTVTIRTRTLALSCNDANKEYAVEVPLRAPLGERVLRDGACAAREAIDRESSCRRGTHSTTVP